MWLWGQTQVLEAANNDAMSSIAMTKFSPQRLDHRALGTG